jgi:hypothetical protein
MLTRVLCFVHSFKNDNPKANLIAILALQKCGDLKKFSLKPSTSFLLRRKVLGEFCD